MQGEYRAVAQDPPKGDEVGIELGTIEVAEVTAATPSYATPEPVNQGSNDRSHSRFSREQILDNMSEKKILIAIAAAIVVVGLILAIILPISFSTMEYYEMGFKQRKSSGTVNTDNVYEAGRHAVGPDSKFKVFPADAHFESFDETVFTADRLQVSISGHFQYFLRPHQLKLLHKNFDLQYKQVLRNNAIDALKGTSTLFTTREYIRNRMTIEQELFKGIRNRLGGICCMKDCNDDCVPNCKPYKTCTEEDFGLFADVRYLQLGELDIPNDLEERYLRALVLQEENEAEKFKQEAQLVRKDTESQVKEKENRAKEISQNANAQSRLIISDAEANSTATRESSRTDGLKFLYHEIGLTDAQHKSSFDYLNTIAQKKDVSLAVDFQTLVAGPMNSHR